ncbi:hypothetical protein V8G54_029045 [Vigna mungo]|uniref:Homologous recombination OB-fold protein OB-fold domain-containing protein n=1 Tax=Vigna mungo TaxID=3915 RepID=A0AAQ3MSL2_VIGMU
MENVTKLECVKSMVRLPFVACIVKECNPNGLGDMKISVKCDSACFFAQKSPFASRVWSGYRVGVVLLLLSVISFSPFGRTYYLNIIVRNVVKVFKADIGPPTDELVRAFSKPHVACDPCGQSNKESKDVGPSEKPTTFGFNNATTTPMED